MIHLSSQWINMETCIRQLALTFLFNDDFDFHNDLAPARHGERFLEWTGTYAHGVDNTYDSDMPGSWRENRKRLRPASNSRGGDESDGESIPGADGYRLRRSFGSSLFAILWTSRRSPIQVCNFPPVLSTENPHEHNTEHEIFIVPRQYTPKEGFSNKYQNLIVVAKLFSQVMRTERKVIIRK